MNVAENRIVLVHGEHIFILFCCKQPKEYLFTYYNKQNLFSYDKQYFTLVRNNTKKKKIPCTTYIIFV